MGAYVRVLRAWQAFQLGEQGKLSRPDGITEEEEEEEEEEMGAKVWSLSLSCGMFKLYLNDPCV